MYSIFENYFNSQNKNNPSSGEIIYLNEEPTEPTEWKIIVKIFGNVQGVGFRYATVHLANQLGINGIVKNKEDGSVYVEAIAEKEKIRDFIKELAKGPSPSARVEKIQVKYDSSVTNYVGFKKVD